MPASRREEVDLETSASSSAPGTPQSPSSSRLGAGQQEQQQQEENEGEGEHHQYSSTPFVAWSTTPLFTTFRRGRIPGDWLYDLCVKERDACRYLCLYFSMVMNDATNMRKHCMTNHRQAVMAAREPQAV